MGRVLLRGPATPVEIFEPVPDFPPSDAHHLAEALNGLSTGSITALAAIAGLMERHPADSALANLYDRLQRTGKGETYVLG